MSTPQNPSSGSQAKPEVVEAFVQQGAEELVEQGDHPADAADTAADVRTELLGGQPEE